MLVETIFIVIVHAYFILGHLPDNIIGSLSVTLHKLLDNGISIHINVDRVSDHLLYFVLHVLYVGHGAVLASSELRAVLSSAPSSRPIIFSEVLRGVYAWSPVHDGRFSGILLSFFPGLV